MGSAGRYSAAHRNRLYRDGMGTSFASMRGDTRLESMGDCGAFAYAREPVPPYTADEVIDFYEACGFDCGFSVDHVILGFDAARRQARDRVQPEWKRRHSLTTRLAKEFLGAMRRAGALSSRSASRRAGAPSPMPRQSRRFSASGYTRVALGGMVPLKTPEILACLEAVAAVLAPGVELHLLGSHAARQHLGVRRVRRHELRQHKPLPAGLHGRRRQLLHARWNVLRYPHPPERRQHQTAQPESAPESCPKSKCVRSRTPRSARVREYATNEARPRARRSTLSAHTRPSSPGPLHGETTTSARLRHGPWESCDCGVCQAAGVEVILFRGTERNKRRGFHNLKIFRERLEPHTGAPASMTRRRSRSRSSATELRLPALRIRQGAGQDVYSFAVDGKKLRSFATVSRAKRSEDTQLSGYQRPEALAHIGAIRKYLESDAPIMPNSIVVAFDQRVSFEPLTSSGSDSDDAVHGHIVVPCSPDEPDAEKPGWIVDGQQRSAAIREARLDHFPVYVTAFVARDEAQQRSQFILVNATKPLPKGLIHELLPTTVDDLPAVLARRRLPAYLVEQLNFREGLPTAGEDQDSDRAGRGDQGQQCAPHARAEHHRRDALPLPRPQTGWGDTEAMLTILSEFWSAAAEVFEDAWDRSARESRLVHGVGFISLGRPHGRNC